MMRLPLALFLTLGCGAPPEIPPEAQWPSSRYWVEEGFGVTPAKAGEDARARIAARIRSRITSRIAAIQGEEDGRIWTHVQRETIEQTDFKHGELIRVVSTRPHADQHRAVAVLEKRAAVERLRADFEAARVPFEAAVEAALSAQSDPQAFTTHDAEARARWPELVTSGLALDSLGDGSLEAVRARARALDEARALMLKKPIALPPFEDPLDGVVRAALLDALKAEGLAVSERCELLTLEPQARVECDSSALGPRCHLRLSAKLKDCQGRVATSLNLQGVRWSAVHPKSVELARRSLPQKVSSERLRPPLQGALRLLLPLEKQGSK